ncbi:MAG TPA: DsbA family protein [Methylovirgula sp.]
MSLMRRAVLAIAILFAAQTFGFAEGSPTRVAPSQTHQPVSKNIDAPHTSGDIAVLGSMTAPVTIIEYASLTCPHCADFAVKTFPELKKRYIDTGKVRFIFREFPLNPLSGAGFMLARCAGKDKYMDVIETLFAKQSEWVVKQPLESLKNLVKPFGFTDDSFKACLHNKQVIAEMQSVAMRGMVSGVHATPTFFVNGRELVGDQSIDAMANAIEPDLKK